MNRSHLQSDTVLCGESCCGLPLGLAWAGPSGKFTQVAHSSFPCPANQPCDLVLPAQNRLHRSDRSDRGYDHHAIFVAWDVEPEAYLIHHPIGRRANPFPGSVGSVEGGGDGGGRG